MKIRFDLHTHTVYSVAPFGTHGKGTVLENALAAQALGLGLAITDHGPAHRFYGVRASAYERLKRDIDAANKKLGGTVALLGIEGNLTSGRGDTDIGELPIVPDVILMGYHKGVKGHKDGGTRFMARCLMSPASMKNRMTDAVVAAMQKSPIDAVTHPGTYVPVEMKEVAKAAAFFGVALEINNRHPISREDVETALCEGAHFILSSDAHSPDKVGALENALSCCAISCIPEKAVANSDAYDFTANLRIDKLRQYASALRV